jgi:hypothetical protein
MSSLLGKIFGRKTPATPASPRFDALYARAASALEPGDRDCAIALDPRDTMAHCNRALLMQRSSVDWNEVLGRIGAGMREQLRE